MFTMKVQVIRNTALFKRGYVNPAAVARPTVQTRVRHPLCFLDCTRPLWKNSWENHGSPGVTDQDFEKRCPMAVHCTHLLIYRCPMYNWNVEIIERRQIFRRFPILGFICHWTDTTRFNCDLLASPIFSHIFCFSLFSFFSFFSFSSPLCPSVRHSIWHNILWQEKFYGITS